MARTTCLLELSIVQYHSVVLYYEYYCCFVLLPFNLLEVRRIINIDVNLSASY